MHSRHVMAVRRGHFTGSVELVRCDVRLCFSIPVLGTQGDCRQRSVGCDRHCQSGPFGFTAVGLARRKKNVQQRHQKVDQPHGGCSGNTQEGEGGVCGNSRWAVSRERQYAALLGAPGE